MLCTLEPYCLCYAKNLSTTVNEKNLNYWIYCEKHLQNNTRHRISGNFTSGIYYPCKHSIDMSSLNPLFYSTSLYYYLIWSPNRLQSTCCWLLKISSNSAILFFTFSFSVIVRKEFVWFPHNQKEQLDFFPSPLSDRWLCVNKIWSTI